MFHQKWFADQMFLLPGAQDGSVLHSDTLPLRRSGTPRH